MAKYMKRLILQYVERIIIVASVILFCCIDCYYSYSVVFQNNSDKEMYFFLDWHIENSYNALEKRPASLIMVSRRGRNMEEYDVDSKGNGSVSAGKIVGVYAFSPDTLVAYDWDEVVAGKKYWFAEVVLKEDVPIQFPEEFTYMGE